MIAQKEKDAAIRSILSAFQTGVRFLKFGEGEDALLLAYRKRGEKIHDFSCTMDFEAMQTGVYKRCLKESAGEKDFVYLYYAPLIDDYLEDALSPVFDSMEPDVVRSIPSDAAFQTMRFEQATANAAKRTKAL